MGLLGVARANTAVGVSPKTFLLLLLLLLLPATTVRGATAAFARPSSATRVDNNAAGKLPACWGRTLFAVQQTYRRPLLQCLGKKALTLASVRLHTMSHAKCISKSTNNTSSAFQLWKENTKEVVSTPKQW
jgi:hypothetical protein